jgi:formylglycine-generating enzyme required for sulfatase activity
MARLAWGVLASALSCSGCSDSAAPRPQLVVVVDTTAPIVSQLQADAELPNVAAIDTLRIDVLAGAPPETREIVAPAVESWPVSFGVAAEPKRSPVLVRLRAFRASLAGGGADPIAEVTIDRVVSLVPPAEGAARVRVTLDFGCIGTRPDFVTERTCIDFDLRSAPYGAAVEALDSAAPETRAGTSPLLPTSDCTTPAPKGTICIRGGFSVLGDPEATGLQASLFVDPVPLRPVLVAPFWLDATELTVGRMRELVEQGKAEVPADQEAGCTWDPSGKSDALPLNCIAEAEAAAVCAALGGTLPSEARWEHAARGRGRGSRFVWGDAAGTCCAASIGRNVGGCGSGIEPVASHTDTATCELADVTRDGVIDMNGSVSEHTLDVNLPYDHACWGGPGLRFEPGCADPYGVPVTRGGNWGSGFAAAQLATRAFRFDPVVQGVRCAYPGTP